MQIQSGCLGNPARTAEFPVLADTVEAGAMVRPVQISGRAD
jgi:hypothetical protein